LVNPAQALSITFTSVPADVTISVLTDENDTSPELLPAGANGNVVFEVPPDDDTWRFEPTFVISIPKRVISEVTLNNAIDMELALSIKRTSDDVNIPVAVFQAIGNNERERIDRVSERNYFQKLLLSQSLARHYHAGLPDPTEAVTRRMTRIWFDVIFDAVTSPTRERPLRMDSEVARLYKAAFAGDASAMATFDERTRQIQSSFWHDRREAAGLLRSRECKSVRALAAYLRSQHEDNREAARVRSLHDADDVLNELDASIVATCGPAPAAGQGSPL
jgi:hypothetical protein